MTRTRADSVTPSEASTRSSRSTGVPLDDAKPGCSKCGGARHFYKGECPGVRCQKCGGIGHVRKECMSMACRECSWGGPYVFHPLGEKCERVERKAAVTKRNAELREARKSAAAPSWGGKVGAEVAKAAADLPAPAPAMRRAPKKAAGEEEDEESTLREVTICARCNRRGHGYRNCRSVRRVYDRVADKWETVVEPTRFLDYLPLAA